MNHEDEVEAAWADVIEQTKEPRAFPFVFPVGSSPRIICTGLTIRDYFAAAALQGLIASREKYSTQFHPEDDAGYCYKIADAMMKAKTV